MRKYVELTPSDSRKSFYGKARVEESNGNKTLISYNTAVCRITSKGKFVRLWGGYSATTMRHINAFCNTYGINGGGKKWWDSLEVE